MQGTSSLASSWRIRHLDRKAVAVEAFDTNNLMPMPTGAQELRLSAAKQNLDLQNKRAEKQVIKDSPCMCCNVVPDVKVSSRFVTLDRGPGVPSGFRLRKRSLSPSLLPPSCRLLSRKAAAGVGLGHLGRKKTLREGAARARKPSPTGRRAIRISSQALFRSSSSASLPWQSPKLGALAQWHAAGHCFRVVNVAVRLWVRELKISSDRRSPGPCNCLKIQFLKNF